jgi:aryl-alcohol dehydrogenase-like predicted oxidoreductase
MIILGTANLGTSYGLYNQQIPNPINFLKSAFESGITMLDTSNGYLNSYEAIAESNIAWDLNVKIRLQNVYKDFFSAAQIEMEKILDQIPKSRIRRVLVHDIRDLIYFDKSEVSEGLTKLKSSFGLEMVGVSVYPEQVASIFSYNIDIVQTTCNILDQRILDLNSIENESFFKLRLQARSIYLQGLLTRSYHNVRDERFVCIELEKFHDWCLVKKLDPSFVSAYFVIQSGLFQDIIIGAASAEELKLNIQYLRSAGDFHIELPYADFKSSNLNIIDPRLWN